VSLEKMMYAVAVDVALVVVVDMVMVVVDMVVVSKQSVQKEN
jgi:hypothetical protein